MLKGDRGNRRLLLELICLCKFLIKVRTGRTYGKESMEVRMTQNMGKEMDNSLLIVETYQLSFHVFMCAFHPEYFVKFPLSITIFFLILENGKLLYHEENNNCSLYDIKNANIILSV